MYTTYMYYKHKYSQTFTHKGYQGNYSAPDKLHRGNQANTRELNNTKNSGGNKAAPRRRYWLNAFYFARIVRRLNEQTIAVPMVSQ